MDPKYVDLARRMLEVIQNTPALQGHLTNRVDDLEGLPLANLFFHLERYFDRATTVKTALNFLTEDVGLTKKSCVLVTVCSSLWVFKTMSAAIAEMSIKTETDYIVARAYNYAEGSELINFFRLNNLMCGLVVESILPNGETPELIKKCRDLPVCVIIHNASPENIIDFLADGATSFVDINKKGEVLYQQFHRAIDGMFIP